MTDIVKLTFSCLKDVQGRTFPPPIIHIVLNGSSQVNH